MMGAEQSSIWSAALRATQQRGGQVDDLVVMPRADEPDYGGFLCGRIASTDEHQLLVVYCRPEALTTAGPALSQLMRGVAALPVPPSPQALVVSDNCDIYGTVDDLIARAGAEDAQSE